MATRKLKTSEINAIQDLKNQIRTAKSKGNFHEVAKLYNALGNQFRLLGRLEEALEQHEEEINICKKYARKDRKGLAIAYRNIGEVLIDMKQGPKSVEAIKTYLQIARDIEDLVEQQRANITLGRAYLTMGTNENAEGQLDNLSSKYLNHAFHFFKEAYALLKEDGLKKQINNEKEFMVMKCSNCQNLGVVLESMGKHTAARDWFKKAVSLAAQSNFHETLAPCYSLLCGIYMKTGNLKEALEAAKLAVKSSKALGSSSMEVESTILEAKALFLLDEVERGKKILKKLRQKVLKKKELHDFTEELDPLLLAAIKICRAQDNLYVTDDTDLSKLMKLHEILGDNYSALENYKEAVTHYKKSCKYAEKLGLRGKQLGKLYFSLAETYKDLNQDEDAYKYYLMEQNLYNGNVVEEFRTQTSIANILEKMKKPEEEIMDAHNGAISLAKLTKSFSKQVLAITNFGLYLKGIGKVEDGEKQIKLAEKIKRENNVADDEDPDSQDLLGDDDESVDLNDLSHEEDSEDEADDDKTARAKKKYSFRRNEAGESPLHLAAKKGELKRVVRLIREGHPVNDKDYAGWAPLHEAANFGHAQVVDELLKHGANVNECGGKAIEDKISPLHDAAGNCHIEVMKVLLKHGANVLAKDSQNRYPVDHLVCWRESSAGVSASELELQECEEMIQLLLQKMAERGKTYRINEKKGRKAGARNRSPEVSHFVANDQDYDCPYAGTITTDTFDPDNEGEGTKQYRNAMKALRSNAERGVNISKGRPREISPGPQGALIDPKQDVHNDNDWLLPDDTVITRENERVKLSNTSKRKRDSLDDVRQNDHHRRRRRRRRSQEHPFDAADDHEEMDIEVQAENTDSEELCRPTSRNASRNSEVFDKEVDDILNAEDSYPFLDDLPVDDSDNNDDFLPSQRPANSKKEFGVTRRDIPIVERDSSDEDRESPVFSRSSRNRMPSMRRGPPERSVVYLSEEGEESDRSTRNRNRQSLSNIAQAFKKTTGNKKAEAANRLGVRIIPNAGRSRNSDSASNHSASSPEVVDIPKRFGRTSSSSSLASNGVGSGRQNGAVWRLKVAVNKDTLLVPLNVNQQNENIDWLAAECATRYAKQFGMKPFLTLQTKDGATLSGSDAISFVLDPSELELNAVVTGYDQPPLVDRYVEACSQASIEQNSDIRSSLHSCQSSNELDVTDSNLRGIAGVVLMNTLQRQNSLRVLILAGTSLFDTGLLELCRVLQTLPGLMELDISSNGITNYGFSMLAETFQKECQPTQNVLTSFHSMPIGLQTFKVSHNPLGNSIGKALSSLLTRLGCLQCLEMADCGFTEKLFSYPELCKAFNGSRLEEVDFSYNNLKSVGVEKFLLSLPARKLKTLNCSSCSMQSGDTGPEVIARSICAFLSQNEDCCNLKSLQLNDCGLNDKAVELVCDNFDRLVRLENIEMALNDHLSSKSLIKILDQTVESSIPLSRLDLSSIPNIWDTPEVNEDLIIGAVERKMNSAKKLVHLSLPTSTADPSKTDTEKEEDMSKLEISLMGLMEDYAGNMTFTSEKCGSTITYRFE